MKKFICLLALLPIICFGGKVYSQGVAGDHENINKLYSIFIDTYDMRNNRDVVEVDKLNEILEAKYDTLQGKKRFLGAALDSY